MRKIIFITILLISCLSSMSVAQVFQKHELSSKVVIGFHSNGHVENRKDPVTFDKSYLYMLETEPYIGYFLTKNLGVGFLFDYMYTKSNFTSYPAFFSYGFFMKYHSSLKIDEPILDRIIFFAEADFNKSNYKIEKLRVYPTVYNKANQTIINFPVGLQFQIWKGLYHEISFEYSIFVGGINHIYPRVGFEYHFKKNN